MTKPGELLTVVGEAQRANRRGSTSDWQTAKEMSNLSDDFWGEPIFSYSRRQAITDRVLFDVTETAREAGLKYPTAVTAAVWHQWIVPDDASRQAGQSEQGRLWDVLWLLRWAIARGQDGSELHYQVLFLIGGTRQQEVELKCVCGPGDDPAPVLTIMLTDED